MLPRRAPTPTRVEAQLLYEADHTCCICRDKKFDVHIHHIKGRHNPSPANLIVLCPNCHSEVTRKGGLGKRYSGEELRRYKASWVREVVVRRRTAKQLDKTLALFDVRRLTYKFEALRQGPSAESRALEIMRVIEQYARDSGCEVKEQCISFVYATSIRLMRRKGSDEFVSHQVSILMECLPIGLGGLVAASKQPLRKYELDLLKHVINVAGEIAYAVCKYIRAKEPAEHAIAMLHDVLHFSVLNDLIACEKQALREFAECERISAQPLREGHAFDAGLQLLKEYKAAAIAS